VTFDRFNGLGGGGPFSLSGSIDVAQGTNPQFDLALTARKFLLTRSDNIIVRSNIDLTVRGPLSTVEISGKVGLVDSRFFQDIDILPLNLPGRPAPQPPSVPPPSSVSITIPPVRDWKFNVKVQTDNPFLVQSNLARGQVTVDLQVGGTGLQPTVTGFVRVDQLTASLPFSHLDINNGYIDFSPGGNPLNPSLNITGVSLIRDYEVRMRVFGDVSNFQIIFDSSPPLAQGDIATLLATGSTTTEFVQNPSLLAGRASFVLAQQLLTKVFKVRPNAQQQSFLERLQVDIIPGDRPGTQDVSARFSLTNNWQLIGEFGQAGDVSGRLRYLIRFR
jgi:autotransporter translocation and assembly factor TamB